MHVQRRILFNNDVLVKFRKEQNITQKQFAEMMGTPPNVVSYWETGRRTPLPPSVDTMVEVTKIPHDIFYDINYETLGTRLTTIRLRKNLSQEDVANKVFTTPAVLNRWEADKHIPSAYYSYKLAEMYNLTVEELLDNDDVPEDITRLETVVKVNRRDLNAIQVDTLGQKIIQLRTLADLNQNTLSDIINTRPENMNRWEADKHMPNVHYVYKIAKVFGLTVEELITNSNGDVLVEDPHSIEILDESIIVPDIKRI